MSGAPAPAKPRPFWETPAGFEDQNPGVLTGVEKIKIIKFKRYTEALFLSQTTIMFFQLIVYLKNYYNCNGTTTAVVAAPKTRDHAVRSHMIKTLQDSTKTDKSRKWQISPSSTNEATSVVVIPLKRSRNNDSDAV